jgi:hypothetical protein
LSPLTPATRRQILADMGIDVWRPRPAGGPDEATLEQTATPAQEAPAQEAPAQAAPRRTTPPPALNPKVRRATGRGESTAAQPLQSATAAEPAQAPTRQARQIADATGSAALSVLSIALPGAVMLIEGELVKRDQRLALDVLAAASGDRQAKPALRRFDGQPVPAGGAVSPGSVHRALQAFVDKDLDDHGARILLCSEPLAALLPEWPQRRRVILPSLDLLGRDAACKRALWQALQRALQETKPDQPARS